MNRDEPGSLRNRLSLPAAPSSLHERVRTAFVQHHALRASKTQRTARTWMRQTAAALFFLAAGAALVLLSQWRADTRADVTPRYALLLYGGEEPLDPGTRSERVAEYRSWAVSLQKEGYEVSGEELGDAVSGGEVVARELSGFFIISAASDAEITDIARRCPHIRHGGQVVVRKLRG